MTDSPLDPSEQDVPRRSLPRWATLLIAVLVLGFLALAVASQWSKVHDADVRFRPLWLLAAVPPLFAFQFAQGEIALLVLRRLRYPIPAVRGRAIFGAALLARYVPTGALSVVLRLGLNEREGVPKRISSVGMIYEIALALAGAAVSVIPLLPSAGPAVIVAAVVPVAGVALLHPVPFSRMVDFALVRAGQPPLARTLPFGEVLLLVGAMCLTFWMAGLSLLCCLLVITPVDAHDLIPVVASFGLGFITSILGFALPGGLGAREAGLVAGLSLTTSTPLALAAAAISRLVQTLIELGYAGIAAGHDRLVRRRGAQAEVRPSR